MQQPFCTHCATFNPVMPVGPESCDVLFLGEAPGWDEHRGKWVHWARKVIREPFIGRSGDELNMMYLPAARLSRERVWLTNTVKCLPPEGTPNESRILSCSRHWLPAELRQVQPKVIVTLGGIAASLFPDIDLELMHGIPQFDQELYGWQGTVFPINHPAAGLHQNPLMIPLQEDFERLGEFLRGRLQVAHDEYPTPVYRRIQRFEDFEADPVIQDDIRQMCFQKSAIESVRNAGREVAIDTETVFGQFWCLTYSTVPGTGFMIRESDRELVQFFAKWLAWLEPNVIYHNYLFDAEILRQVGITTPRFTDTMVEAYHTGSLPQGLKALAYRLCGMRMQSYEDVVLPYGRQQAAEWLGAAVELGERQQMPWKPGKRRCSGIKAYGGKHQSADVVFAEPMPAECPVCGRPLDPPKMERQGDSKEPWGRARSLLSTWMKGEDAQSRPKYVWDRWKQLPDECRGWLEERLGPFPYPNISQVPEDEAIVYACRDSDATLRVKPQIRRYANEQARRVRG